MAYGIFSATPNFLSLRKLFACLCMSIHSQFLPPFHIISKHIRKLIKFWINNLYFFFERYVFIVGFIYIAFVKFTVSFYRFYFAKDFRSVAMCVYVVVVAWFNLPPYTYIRINNKDHVSTAEAINARTFVVRKVFVLGRN